MKRIIAICLLLTTIISYKVSGSPAKIRATVYLPTGNPTASGVMPYEGIIATNREHLGQRAALYTESGEFIGYFLSADTGGHKGLKNGTRIDIFRKSEESYREWVNKYGDYVLIEWVEE